MAEADDSPGPALVYRTVTAPAQRPALGGPRVSFREQVLTRSRTATQGLGLTIDSGLAATDDDEGGERRRGGRKLAPFPRTPPPPPPTSKPKRRLRTLLSFSRWRSGIAGDVVATGPPPPPLSQKSGRQPSVTSATPSSSARRPSGFVGNGGFVYLQHGGDKCQDVDDDDDDEEEEGGNSDDGTDVEEEDDKRGKVLGRPSLQSSSSATKRPESTPPPSKRLPVLTQTRPSSAPR